MSAFMPIISGQHWTLGVEFLMNKPRSVPKKVRRLSPSTIAQQTAFLRAYVQTGGVVLTACQLTKITRQNHYNWLASDPVYAAAFERGSEEAISRITQLAERGVIKNAKKGNRACLKFINEYWGEPVLAAILRGENPFGAR